MTLVEESLLASLHYKLRISAEIRADRAESVSAALAAERDTIKSDMTALRDQVKAMREWIVKWKMKPEAAQHSVEAMTIRQMTDELDAIFPDATPEDSTR